LPRASHGLVGLLAAFALIGCDLVPTVGPVVRVENHTNTPVAVRVNASLVGTYAAGSSVDVPLAGAGGPPYHVSVHSPSGHELAQFDVSANDIESAPKDLGGSAATFVLGCGTIRLSSGPIELDPAFPHDPGPEACH
jgi:hypothetical protein